MKLNRWLMITVLSCISGAAMAEESLNRYVLDIDPTQVDAFAKYAMQDEVARVHGEHRTTTVLVTHDVDEAVLLSDRVVMMTNGPAATIGEILEVKLDKPRDRLKLAHDPQFAEYRAAILEFLYQKQLKHAA